MPEFQQSWYGTRETVTDAREKLLAETKVHKFYTFHIGTATHAL